MAFNAAFFQSVILSQFEAALAMFRDCLAKCPEEHWDAPIAHYSFWQVAYHTICFVDCYLASSDTAFEFRTTTSPAHAPCGQPLHPLGRAELENEFPSRRFDQRELLAYVDLCLDKMRTVFSDETAETLAGPSGFPRLKFTRAELHLYNMRHVQHHTGQLSACLRRESNETIDPRWVGAGWRV